MREEKKGLRWWLFNKFGPPSVQNMINYIDHIMDDEHVDSVCIYPGGQFNFQVRTSDGDSEPYTFLTPQERASFAVGLQLGVSIMGGGSHSMTDEQMEALDRMEKKATHGDGGSFNN